MKIEKSVLQELVSKGYSHRKMAELLGCSRTTIGYYLKQYNLSSANAPRKLPLHWNKIDSKEKAYTLGFLLADGHINEKNLIDIKVALADEQVIHFISKVLDSEVKYDYTFNKKQRKYPSVSTKRVVKDITKFTGGRLKNERHYPIIPKHLERYMLLGFFDADGCITWGRRKDRNIVWQKISFNSQLKLLEGVQKMLYNNICISSVIRPKKGEDCYVIEFSAKNDVLKFLDYIYADEDFIILERKYLKAKALRLELEEIGGTAKQ